MTRYRRVEPMKESDDRWHFLLAFGEIACTAKARKMNLTTYMQNVTCDDCNDRIHRVLADGVRALRHADQHR